MGCFHRTAVQVKHSKKLVSADNHSNIFNFHYTYLVTLVPVCKDDLVLLPRRLAEQLGSISRLVLTQRISNAIHFVDPLTAQTADVTEEKVRYIPGMLDPWCLPVGRFPWFREIDTPRNFLSNEIFFIGGVLSDATVATPVTLDSEAILPPTPLAVESRNMQYWRQEFGALLSSTRLAPYVVLATEPLPDKKRPAAPRGHRVRKARLAEVELARDSDLGRNDNRVHAVSHLGHILRAGDTVLGYDISSANFPDGEASALERSLPDVILVRKVYPRNRGDSEDTAGARTWKLAELEADGDGVGSARAGAGTARGEAATEKDYERFLQQLESDKDMRRQVRLYKSGAAIPTTSGIGEGEADEEEILLDELLDGMTLDDPKTAPDDDENAEASIFEIENAPMPNADTLATLGDREL